MLVGVFSHPTLQWISSNSYQLNLLLASSHQAEIIIVKRLIQGRNNLARVGVEVRSCHHGINNFFALSTTTCHKHSFPLAIFLTALEISTSTLNFTAWAWTFESILSKMVLLHNATLNRQCMVEAIAVGSYNSFSNTLILHISWKAVCLVYELVYLK